MRRLVTTQLPDAALSRSDPAYLRALLDCAGLSQRAAARQLGINDRTMRRYCSGDRPLPYPEQFCLEVLATARRSSVKG